MKEIIKHWEDINFAAYFKKEHPHFVDFKAYKTCEPESRITDISESYLHGDVKYDGCSNIDIDVMDKMMLHFCSKEEAANLGILLSRIYDTAFEMMPEYSD